MSEILNIYKIISYYAWNINATIIVEHSFYVYVCIRDTDSYRISHCCMILDVPSLARSLVFLLTHSILFCFQQSFKSASWKNIYSVTIMYNFHISQYRDELLVSYIFFLVLFSDKWSNFIKRLERNRRHLYVANKKFKHAGWNAV